LSGSEEVFKQNTIGRKFYANYGFSLLTEKTHEPTGNKLLRLKFTANKGVNQDARKLAPATQAV